MRGFAIAAACAFTLGTLSWVGSDRAEQDNDFCNACHLPSGTALHIETREEFDRITPVSLASLHGRAWLEERDDPAFRCIDCHAGSGPVERLRVKLLSARDGIRYFVSDFEEPRGMSFDLSAALCLECHPTFRHSAAPGWTVESYHGHPAHDEAADAPSCVACHSVHETDGDGIAYFMNRPRVDRQCRECHTPGSDMEIPSLVPTRRE